MKKCVEWRGTLRFLREETWLTVNRTIAIPNRGELAWPWTREDLWFWSTFSCFWWYFISGVTGLLGSNLLYYDEVSFCVSICFRALPNRCFQLGRLFAQMLKNSEHFKIWKFSFSKTNPFSLANSLILKYTNNFNFGNIQSIVC